MDILVKRLMALGVYNPAEGVIGTCVALVLATGLQNGVGSTFDADYAFQLVKLDYAFPMASAVLVRLLTLLPSFMSMMYKSH